MEKTKTQFIVEASCQTEKQELAEIAAELRTVLTEVLAIIK